MSEFISKIVSNQIVSNISNIACEFIYHVNKVNSLEAASSNSRGGVLLHRKAHGMTFLSWAQR